MTNSVLGMGSAEVLVFCSGFGDHQLEVDRIGYCDAEVVPQSLHVILDVCASEDVVLLCQEPLQDFGKVTAVGIEDLEHKDTSADAQLQDSSCDIAAREPFPLGVQSNELAAPLR